MNSYIKIDETHLFFIYLKTKFINTKIHEPQSHLAKNIRTHENTFSPLKIVFTFRFYVL